MCLFVGFKTHYCKNCDTKSDTVFKSDITRLLGRKLIKVFPHLGHNTVHRLSLPITVMRGRDLENREKLYSYKRWGEAPLSALWKTRRVVFWRRALCFQASPLCFVGCLLWCSLGSINNRSSSSNERPSKLPAHGKPAVPSLVWSTRRKIFQKRVCSGMPRFDVVCGWFCLEPADLIEWLMKVTHSLEVGNTVGSKQIILKVSLLWNGSCCMSKTQKWALVRPYHWHFKGYMILYLERDKYSQI